MLSRFAIVLIIVFTQIVFKPNLRAEPLDLAPDQTVIAVANTASLNGLNPATLLQTWLRKACRVAVGFEIVRENEPAQLAGKMIIAVGQTQWARDPRLAKLNADGFLIHHEGNVISIAGRTDDAALYGAVAFLDRAAGVRFYLPSDSWTSLPARPRVIYDGADFLSQPFVISASMSGLDTKDPAQNDWLHLTGALRLKGGTHQHNLWAIFPPEKFAAAHPEIYPVYDGARYIPQSASDQSWQIDFTEPATLVAAEESVTEYFAKNPQSLYLAVSINDSWRWSESDSNKAIFDAYNARNPQGRKDPQGKYPVAASSDIYWRFINQLGGWMQKTWPGHLLVALAYGPTSIAPDFRLDDNVVAFTVLHIADLEGEGYLRAHDAQLPELDQWLADASNYGNHDWEQGDGYLIPRIYSSYWSRFLQTLAARWPQAFMHSEAYPNWGFDGPKLYVTTRLWWDPQTDPKAIVQQFCNDMFGPAAPAMNDYFNQLEALWIQLDDADGPRRKMGAWTDQFQTTPASRALIASCRAALNKAVSTAMTDAERQRVALFARCFAFSESLFALAAAPATDQAAYNRARILAQTIATDRWAVYDPQSPLAAVESLRQAQLAQSSPATAQPKK